MQLVGHPHLPADRASGVKLAPGEGVRKDVRVAVAVGDEHPISQANELGETLEFRKDLLHQGRLGRLVSEAEGGGQGVDFGHDEGLVGDAVAEGFNLAEEGDELRDRHREPELFSRERGMIGVAPASAA